MKFFALATLATAGPALAKKVSIAAAPSRAGLNLQNAGGATASVTYTSSGGLEIRASKCVDRSSFCGRYKRSDCMGSGAAVRKMTFNTKDKKHQHHIMLSDDGTLSFDVGGGGCVNPVASWDVVPDHGTKFNGEFDAAFITTSSIGLDVMSQAGFTVNGDSIEPRCGCDHGTAATDSCNAHEDHHCTSCDAGYFLAGKTCKAWQTCVAGSGMTKEGTGSADRQCAPCAVGASFSAVDDGSACKAVRVPCPAGTHITAAATASTDMTCGGCDAGTFTSAPGQASCAAWATCPPGQGQHNAPSATADRTCTACTLGSSFSGADDGNPCTAADACTAGEYEKVAPTLTSDRTCATHAPACASHEYESRAPSDTQDRECKQKVCHCPNGVRTTGDACPKHGDPKCASCVGAYHLANGDRQCDANICSCLHGTVATGATCVVHGATKCTRCNGGYHMEGQNCVITPIDGGWSDWGALEACSVSGCGQTGTRTKRRTCTNPAPQHGGAGCSGSASDSSTACSTGPCPINGNWGSFSEWTSCSATCGGGTQSRSRQCNNPAPAHGGAGCTGSHTMTRSCNPTACCAGPHYGYKDGVCRPSCGALGGPSARSFNSGSCEQRCMGDAGTAYDVPLCCVPNGRPAPHYGQKNGRCMGSCGAIGGTSSFKDSCANHGKGPAPGGEMNAYDVPHCCR